MAASLLEVGVAMGSNLGDRHLELDTARDYLKKFLQRAEVSAYLETAPVDCPPGSAIFINACVVGKLDPKKCPAIKLLSQLIAYEQKRGRAVPHERNAPRRIDLDLIYYGDRVIQEANLFVPHPQAWQRRFVLQPLQELRPNLILPGQNKTVQELLEQLP